MTVLNNQSIKFKDIYYFDRKKKVIFFINNLIVTLINNLNLKKLIKYLSINFVTVRYWLL